MFSATAIGAEVVAGGSDMGGALPSRARDQTARRAPRSYRPGMDETAGPRAPVPGWTGRFFEDLVVGDVYEHPLGRTVLPTDNAWFTLLTQNTAPIHFDAHYASQTEWGKPLVASTFTLALVTGQSVTDVSQNVMANLGWDTVRLPNPVFEGGRHHPRAP